MSISIMNIVDLFLRAHVYPLGCMGFFVPVLYLPESTIFLGRTRRAEIFSAAIRVIAAIRLAIMFFNTSVLFCPALLQLITRTAGTKKTCRSEEKYV
jgi:hypothetical protein